MATTAGATAKGPAGAGGDPGEGHRLDAPGGGGDRRVAGAAEPAWQASTIAIGYPDGTAAWNALRAAGGSVNGLRDMARGRTPAPAAAPRAGPQGGRAQSSVGAWAVVKPARA